MARLRRKTFLGGLLGEYSGLSLSNLAIVGVKKPFF